MLSAKEEAILNTVKYNELNGREIKEIIKEILGIELGSETLYPPLNRLYKEGLVTRRNEKTSKFYKITNAGSKYLERKEQQLKALQEGKKSLRKRNQASYQ